MELSTISYLLFPSLEKSMRKIEFIEEVEENGKMNFRAYKGFGHKYMWKGEEGPPAADGQMGTIVRAYREWKFTGDDDFIKEVHLYRRVGKYHNK